MLNKLKSGLLNLGLKFMSIDEKIVRMFLETSPNSVNEIVILPAVKMVMKKLVGKLTEKRVKGRVYNGKINGIPVSIVMSYVGCPNMAIALECFKRCSTKVIVRLDFCGGFSLNNDQIDVGDLLIPRLSYCGDGTTPYYLFKHPDLKNQLGNSEKPIDGLELLGSQGKGYYYGKPDERLKEILHAQANQQYGSKSREADFWTIDAFFCETDELITSIKEMGVKGIDMENSILFLLGELFKIRTASILSVSDLPGHSKYDTMKSNEIHPNLITGVDNAISVLYNALPKIQKEFNLK